MKQLLILIALPFAICAQITSRFDTINYNQSIKVNFSTQNIIKDFESRFDVPPCSVSLGDIDSYVYFTGLVCVCPCTKYCSITSVRLFYKSKIKFQALNLSQPLNLLDSMLFISLDTVHKISSQTGCWFPSAIITMNMRNYDTIFICKTTQNKYVMVLIKPVDTTVISYCNGYLDTITYLHHAIIAWYLQTDGSLDFSGVDQTEIKEPSSHKKLSAPLCNSRRNTGRCYLGLSKDFSRNNNNPVYSLKGEQIKSANIGKINGLVIYRK